MSLINEETVGLARTPVYWLLGLPFDLVDTEAAIQHIDSAVRDRQSLVFATPNVNFFALAGRSRTFLINVLRTDLSFVDGMPLVWLGRMLGIPFRERVSGSSLLERIIDRGISVPIRLFFFGGEEGVSEAASVRVNNSHPNVGAVGALSPGFGSVDELSTAEILDQVNSAEADFLVVALGAEKGHEWIARNRDALSVSVVSHLGATVNFLAGTVRRAPRIMQAIGFEWLWRIYEEPKLIARYFRDGLFFCRILLLNAMPVVLGRLFGQLFGQKDIRFVCVSSDRDSLELRGLFLEECVGTVSAAIWERIDGGATRVRIDLSQVTALDCRSIGFLYELRFRQLIPVRVELVGNGRSLESILNRHRAEILLQNMTETSDD